ncbi:hypothetical protein FHS43_002451 [Streptosporangium becharense]|uniref:Uncharacterized protein n=1 Tax=Streptosporangium becharense TaxID=1816182 RepID=A0A7W9MIL7_9ACTN|nr:hypothetical protein [Streptosporangium becharense]MBB2911186.1 hypothetical protein [Streptosporangium becharense]MBB5821756.1 hypothetical protein [Streptosporangium becharense]
MRFSFGPYRNRLAAAVLVGASALTAAGVTSVLPASAATPVLAPAVPAVHTAPVADTPEAAGERVMLQGSTTASYFWDDSSGRAGDTGLPASGKPMQKGMAASPSWPLFTEGYVIYKGKKAKFFVGDRGPGEPSNRGIMLDLDAKTFADLTGGTFNSRTLMVNGNGGMGHIKVQYVITKWGDGVGRKNHPVAFSTGAWGRKDRNPATPPKPLVAKPAPKKAQEPKVVAEPKQAVRPEAETESAAKPAAKSSTEPVAAPEAGASANVVPATGAEAAEKDARNLAGTANAAATSPSDSTGAVAVVLAGLAVVGGGAYLVTGRLRRSTGRRGI